MKTLHKLTALTSKELTSYIGGFQGLTDGSTNTLPIIPFGDPQDWDVYFPEIEASNNSSTIEP